MRDFEGQRHDKVCRASSEDNPVVGRMEGGQGRPRKALCERAGTSGRSRMKLEAGPLAEFEEIRHISSRFRPSVVFLPFVVLREYVSYRNR